MDLDMPVQGMGSSNGRLIWYVDRVEGALPTPAILSLPVLVWRIAMLLWSLWLVSALLAWLQWGWQAFADGGLWRKRVFTPKPPIPPPPSVR